MKILWITNVELPAIAKYHGRPVYVGGWMDLASKLIAKQECIELHVLCASMAYEEVQIDDIYYSGFSHKNAGKEMACVIEQLNPDIIHIWGSEYVHSYEAVNILEKNKMLDRALVSIQGLVSVYPEHYYAGLPFKVLSKKTLYERVKRMGIVDACKKMKKQGELEKIVFKKVSHCIGRTDWDYACVKQMNDKIVYHKCNEILRSSFYEYEWNLKSCEAFSIAFSQAHYPIKGLHYMLEALQIIKRKYPAVKLYVLGQSPFIVNTLKEKIKHSTYMKYLKKLVVKFQLQDNIEWIGSCNEEQMVKHYLRANVFVCASSIENSSNSIGEAMILGLPVVASDVGGIKSLMEHGKEGLLYQADAPYMLADCIMRILGDDKMAEFLGKNARKRAMETHDREKNTIDLLKIYSELTEA